MYLQGNGGKGKKTLSILSQKSLYLKWNKNQSQRHSSSNNVIQIFAFPLYQDRFAQVFAIVCIQPTVLYIYIYVYIINFDFFKFVFKMEVVTLIGMCTGPSDPSATHL